MAEKGETSHEEVKELTDQFYVTLRAYVARLDKDDESRSPKSFKQVEDRLKEGKATWSDAYQMEQLLVDLFDERSLDVELQSRLLEAESSLRPVVAAHYVKMAGALKTSAERRALLARLVNDLQWRYTVNEVKRGYSKEVTKITGLIFIVAIGLFATAVLGTAVFAKVLSEAGDAALLLLAGLAGGWGASFSMLANLKGRMDAAELNDLKLMKSRWILWSRPLIGVGAACILYFFLVSGLLGGAAFPNLKRDQEPRSQSETVPGGGPATTETRTAPVGGNAPTPMRSSRTDMALLIVWCFVAGFSERLVPALLAKTEGRAIGQSSLGPERFKPSPADGEGTDRTGGREQEKMEARSSDRAAPPPGRTTTEPPKTS